MKFTIELDREVDGRWIAEVMELGVIVYGATKQEAISKAQIYGLEALVWELEKEPEKAEAIDLPFILA